MRQRTCMLQGLRSISTNTGHSVVDYRLCLIGADTDRFNAKKSSTSSLERLYNCLPSFRVPLQPTRYGVSVQAGGAIVGISFAHSILLAAGMALVFFSFWYALFAMLSHPVRCLMCAISDEQRACCIRISAKGVDSALTDEEMERYARAILVAVTYAYWSWVSGTTTLEVGKGAFVLIYFLIERIKAYCYCIQ